MSDWTPELVVDEPLARRLLAQFPALETASLRPLAQGWDYTIWVADEQWAFRFPRRAIAIPGVELEVRTLPQLAPLLPLPVPAPEFVGEPTDEFPWPFFGSRLLPGRELTTLELDEEGRARVATQLGEFLRALHAADVPGLPPDSNRRAEMKIRVPKTREQLAQIGALWSPPPIVAEIFAEAEALPEPELDTVVHGDLHVRQLLAEPDGRLTGVVDWVDVCRSDPAIDLSMYWSYFPPAARERFVAAYGAIDDAQLVRARVLALSLGAALAAYGAAENNPQLLREALAGLRAATTSG